MKPLCENVVVYQGATWQPVLQWLSEQPTYKVISGVTLGLPTEVTATTHGIAVGTRLPVWITDVKGPRGLNTAGFSAEVIPQWATAGDANTLLVDFDSGALSPYQGGGVLTYRAPIDLTGWTARDQARTDLQATTTLFDLTTGNGITLGADGTIARVLTAAQTAALPPTQGVHILELTDPLGNVTRFAEGSMFISPDFTVVVP